MPPPKKPYFGAKRRRATRADGTKTRRVHHGALGVRPLPTPRAAHSPRAANA
jgi:hypothetical protein